MEQICAYLMRARRHAWTASYAGPRKPDAEQRSRVGEPHSAWERYFHVAT